MRTSADPPNDSGLSLWLQVIECGLRLYVHVVIAVVRALDSAVRVAARFFRARACPQCGAGWFLDGTTLPHYGCVWRCSQCGTLWNIDHPHP
jgi:predicted Zn finger-like uncharacterized protein